MKNTSYTVVEGTVNIQVTTHNVTLYVVISGFANESFDFMLKCRVLYKIKRMDVLRCP